MPTARDLRRCALQALYQFDAAGDEAPDIVLESLEDSAGSVRTHQDGFALAQAAWAMREEADATVAALTPEWPTHRQPIVDRNILRLAYCEIVSGRTPPKVAINEAVELAKEFSTEKSPLFVNGVLDRIYKTRRDGGEEQTDDAGEPATTTPAPEFPVPTVPRPTSAPDPLSAAAPTPPGGTPSTET